MSSTADVIRERAEQVVRTVRADELGGYRWIKNLIKTTVSDYRGRFLHELIQNAFDAHPEETRDGKIAVHFYPDEGAHGVLYVGNGGRPLTRSNFERMASLGDSDKLVGEGIGNKGVGFKSVFQICAAPEVYSAEAPEMPGFSGYSFRFGRRSDLDDFLEPDDPQRSKVEGELALELLTIPLETVPPVAARLREDGFVTVLRLPASSPQAATEIRDRIARLLGSRSPVMLFLDRLASLSVWDGEGSPTLLTRHSGGDGLGEVVLNGHESYYMFERVVPQVQLHRALEDAVGEGTLDEHWLKWRAEAKVSVAVGKGWGVPDPAPFTFLPMGDSERSPLGGHVNAPFVTNFNRLALDTEHPVNDLLLRHVAELCLDAATGLIEQQQDPGAAIDLLAWEGDPGRIAEALERRGEDLAHVLRLPALKAEQWAPVAHLSLWNSATLPEVITAARLVADASALLVSTDDIDALRLERLARAVGDDELTPSTDQVAGWVEQIAAKLLAQGASFDLWQSFYNDLPLLFPAETDAQALAGRRILLAEDGLVPADHRPEVSSPGRGRTRARRAVYFAPRTSSTDDDDAVDDDIDITPPRSLSRRIVFLNRGLQWHEGAVQTPGRRFLQGNGLARQFRTASLLGHLGQIMSTDPDDVTKRDALDFAFRLFSSDPTRHSKELRSVGLEVPTMTGRWIAAQTARFSAGWPREGAVELSDLAAGARDQESELHSLADYLLADPETVGGPNAVADQWADFLEVLGTSATPVIGQAVEKRRLLGSWLTNTMLAGYGPPPDLPSGVVGQWKTALSAKGNTAHPQTEFSTRDPAFWLLGQHEVEALSGRLRTAYARAVMRTLPALADVHKYSTWRRDRAGGENSRIPTPLWAFVTHASWLPVAIPGQRDREFLPACECWYVGNEDAMAASYSPLVDSRMRSLMDEIGPKHWRPVGILAWSDPDNAAELVNHLTALYANEGVPDTALDHFRSSLAWTWNIIGDPDYPSGPDLDNNPLVVESSGQLTVQGRDDFGPGQRLFVVGTADQSATAKLVREMGWPVVPVEGLDPVRLSEVARFLRDSWHDNVEVASNWEVGVVVDGTEWKPTDEAPRLSAQIPWLSLLIAACMRFPRASGMRVGKQLARVIDDLDRIRLASAASIGISSSEGAEPLPLRLRGVLPMSGDIPTLIVAGQQMPPTWAQLEDLAQGALELLGSERFKAEVSLTIRDLSPGVEHTISRPSNAEIADVLQVAEAQVAEIEAAASGAVAGIALRIRHLAPVLWGEAGVEAFTADRIASLSRDELVHQLVELSGSEDQASSILSAAENSSTADELRRRLAVPLAQYNAALIRYFPFVPLVSYATSHAEDLDLRRRQRYRELVDWVRSARIDRFDRGEVQQDWVTLRELEFLTPDPAWATTLDDVGVELLDERIDSEMTLRLGPPGDVSALPDFDQVRSANGRALRERLSAAGRVVTAWCERQSAARPVGWTADGFEGELRGRLDNAGALDFRQLDDKDMAVWLDRIEVWPANMPLTVDPESLGLSGDELHAREKADEDARAAKARAARRLVFQGKELELEPSMSRLVDQVSIFLESAPSSLNTPYRTSALHELGVATRPGVAGGRSGRPPRVVRNRLSTEQTDAIGLIGEMIAFHWLKHRDPSGVVDESCWKSGNSRFVVEGAIGDDGLGYDFEVPRRGGAVMYEVKSTSGDSGMVELGETEVRCAQQFSRTDRWRLLIVEDALSPAPRVHMLPNPFRPESRGLYRFVGNSVRLRFRLPVD